MIKVVEFVHGKEVVNKGVCYNNNLKNSPCVVLASSVHSDSFSTSNQVYPSPPVLLPSIESTPQVYQSPLQSTQTYSPSPYSSTNQYPSPSTQQYPSPHISTEITLCDHYLRNLSTYQPVSRQPLNQSNDYPFQPLNQSYDSPIQPLNQSYDSPFQPHNPNYLNLNQVQNPFLLLLDHLLLHIILS